MKSYMQRKMDLINQQLNEIYTENMALNKDLAKAMNYSLMAGGKRLRPILIMAAVDALGVDGEKFLRLSTSIEFIHTYSLIHDDLPAMDNDDYRRGKLTNHKVFGEALAILAGDALLTMAFEIIATDKNVDAETKVKIITEMSKAAGAEGMVGGQVIDMQSEIKNRYTDFKTNACCQNRCIILCCYSFRCYLGWCWWKQLANLTEYARQFGLAFQITDDILDVVGDEKTIGKPVGSDEKIINPHMLLWVH